jgi:GNAT superfamily N-acetyltransferase
MKDILIRRMRAEEKRDVGAIMRRSFSLTQQWFFSWTSDVLVAEQDGKLLGAVVLKMFPLPGGRKGGLVAWVFTAPKARGTGAGQRLIESALEFFEEQGCDEAMACVEGYNTSLCHAGFLNPFTGRAIPALRAGGFGNMVDHWMRDCPQP